MVDEQRISPRLQLEPKRIYIMAPFRAPTPEGVKANVDAAVKVAAQITALGHYPFCPHLAYYIDELLKEYGIHKSAEYWLDWGLVWLGFADAAIAPFENDSEGVQWEKEQAQVCRIPVYQSITELEQEEMQ